MSYNLSSYLPLVLKLFWAALFGSILGLNRQFRGKSAGLRTHAMVALGSALVVMIVTRAGVDLNAISRVLQGVITGIGFLGAGVILHRDTEQRIFGLTTAASIWLAAMLGLACGAGQADLAGIALVIAIILLTTGGGLENWIVKRFGGKKKADHQDNETE